MSKFKQYMVSYQIHPGHRRPPELLKWETHMFRFASNTRVLDPTTAPYAAFILRLSLGVVLLAHSLYLKLFVFTLPGTAQYFESIGLPAALAYLVFFAEAIGGLALITGYRTRLVSLSLIPILLGATWAHSGNGWVFSSQGGGWEFPLFLVAMAVVQVLLGDGALSLSADRPEDHEVGAAQL
jgi:putative oxidoreductase